MYCPLEIKGIVRDGWFTLASLAKQNASTRHKENIAFNQIYRQWNVIVSVRVPLMWLVYRFNHPSYICQDNVTVN